MENLGHEEENIIKDSVKIFFRLKKEPNYTAIKDIISISRQEKETKAIKNRILRDIKNFFEHEKEEENYYKPVRVSNFWSNNYIDYESNGDRNKTPLAGEYLDKIRPHLKSGKVKHELRVTSLDPRVTGSNPQVTTSNTRVTTSNPRVTRVQIHEL